MHHYMPPLKPLLPDLQSSLILLLPPSHNNINNKQIGLVLFNASRQQMDFSDSELRDDLTALHSVPPRMLDAAEAMLSALVQTQRQAPSKQRETSVYVGGPLPGVCRICGVDRYASRSLETRERKSRIFSSCQACIVPSTHTFLSYVHPTRQHAKTHQQRGRPRRRRLQAPAALLRL